MSKLVASTLADSMRGAMYKRYPGKAGQMDTAVRVILQNAIDSKMDIRSAKHIARNINYVLYKYLTDPAFQYGSEYADLDDEELMELDFVEELKELYIDYKKVDWDFLSGRADEAYPDFVCSADTEPKEYQRKVRGEGKKKASKPVNPSTVPKVGDFDAISADEPAANIRQKPETYEEEKPASKPINQPTNNYVPTKEKEAPTVEDLFIDSRRIIDSGSSSDGSSGGDVWDMTLTSDGFQISQDRSSQTLMVHTCPAVDTGSVFAVGTDLVNRPIPIYRTLPEIPTMPFEVSATTDITRMSNSDFMRLFPSKLIRARHPSMYSTSIKENVFGEPLEYEVDEVLGFIPTITGFSREQVIDNIIKYPQFTYWYRGERDERTQFHKFVETKGELVPYSDWVRNKSNKDLRRIPNSFNHVCDYLFRRYKLEEDVRHIQHKYPIYGTFGPFMSLFMPEEMYLRMGYRDTLDIAKQCVQNRIDFFRSRNPLFVKMNRDGGAVNPNNSERRMCPFSSQCERGWCDYSCGKNAMFTTMLGKSKIRVADIGRITPELRDKVCGDIMENSGKNIYISANSDSKFLGDIYAWVAMCQLCPYFGSDISVYHMRFSRYIDVTKSSWNYREESQELIESRAFAHSSRVLIITGLEYVQYKDFESQTLLSLLRDRNDNSSLTTILIGPHPKRWLTRFNSSNPFFDALYRELERCVANYCGSKGSEQR